MHDPSHSTFNDYCKSVSLMKTSFLQETWSNTGKHQVGWQKTDGCAIWMDIKHQHCSPHSSIANILCRFYTNCTPPPPPPLTHAPFTILRLGALVTLEISFCGTYYHNYATMELHVCMKHNHGSGQLIWPHPYTFVLNHLFM